MKNKRKILACLIIVLAILFLIKKTSFYHNQYNNDVPSVRTGDINMDGSINSADYILVRKYLLKSMTLTNVQMRLADMNYDNKVNSQDYILIRKFLLNGEVVVKPTPIPAKPTAVPVTPTPKPQGYEDKDAKVVDSKYSYTIANINVIDYGADPTGVKDSTNAFKTALAKANECMTSHTCGGTVYAPKGKYLITDTLSIGTYVSLIGDLEEGTTNGTILMIKHGAGSSDYKKSAIIAQVLSSIQNIAFYYPDQKIDASGNVTVYPPTITFGSGGTDGITFDNLYFVNSYIAMDFASSRENISIQYIRNIYGTPLHIGIINDTNYDTMKMENINFSPKYWLKSGLSNIPSESSLRSVLMNSSTMPSAIVLKRLDWFFLANINIDGYFMGFKFDKSGRSGVAGGAEGEMFDSRIVDCYYPIYIYYSKHMTITDTKLTATGGGGARAIHISPGCDFDYSINNCEISSNGDYAIYNGGKRRMSIASSKVTGRIGNANSLPIAFVGDTLTNTGFDSNSLGDPEGITKVNYSKRAVTKPKSKNLIKISASQNEDITNKIIDAISKLKSIGGIVYIPNGEYVVSSHIDVPSGIEIRGAVPWAHHRGYPGTTVLKTTYKSDSIFTLQSNSGINGLDIIQVDNWEGKSNSLTEYPNYVIKGNGSNVYIINVALPAVWNGIDLTGCDNHYVEHIWGEFYNIGINVGGGSKDGIIKESHFTINVLNNATEISKQTALTKQTVMKIGTSTNEIIFNTFTFGPGVGYHFDGATNFNAIGIGVDYSNVGIKISGSATGQIINPLLVIKPSAVIDSFAKLSNIVSYKNMHYIETTSSYSGFVKIFNSLNWGSNDSIAFDFSGKGDLHINSGIIENSASPAIRTSNSALSANGLILGYPINNTRVVVDNGVWGVNMIGNICVDGKGIAYKLINNAGINVGIQESK